MDAKEAAILAKKHIETLFADEGVRELGLEEIRRNERRGGWEVTVSFVLSRDLKTGLLPPQLDGRCFKTVFVRNRDGEITEMRRRMLLSA